MSHHTHFFAQHLRFLALTLLLAGFPTAGLLAQTDGTAGDAAGGVGDSPLGFDAGVTLERGERNTRDTGTFVGAEAPTVGNFGAANDSGNPLQGRAGGLNQQGQFFNFFNQLNRTNQLNNQQNQLRVPLRLGFAKPPSPATNAVVSRRLTTSLQSRFDSLARFPRPIIVSFEADTVVLTGQVSDDQSRRLAERLVMLEPGVRGVKNELEIVDTAIEAELLPPAPPR